MDVKGEFVIPAPRAEVWAALNDPEILRRSIPGCKQIEKLSDTEMTATTALKIGPVRATFKGKVTLGDLDPPNAYTITGEGQGGVAGFARGTAKVRLEDAENGATRLSYEVKATVGGKLVQVGQRLLDTTARKLAGDFFARFSEAVAAPPSAAAAPPGEAPTAPEPTAATRGLPPWIWITGVVIVVAALLLIFAT